MTWNSMQKLQFVFYLRVSVVHPNVTLSLLSKRCDCARQPTIAKLFEMKDLALKLLIHYIGRAIGGYVS